MPSKKKKELYRDLLALASPIMFFLVFARAAIEPFRPFMDRMLISGMFLLLLWFFVSYEGYSARAIPIAFFTSSFYQDLAFTIFVSIVVAGILYSSYRMNGVKKILIGAAIGVASTILGFVIATFTY